MVSKVSFKIKLSDLVSPEELEKLTQPTLKSIANDIGEFVVDKILADTSNQRSAVTGRQWKGLSKDYKAKKTRIASSRANLELHGHMLDALKAKGRAEEIEVGVFGKEQALKADGHCHTGIFGTSKLPPRRFIPREGETLRSGLMGQITRLAKDLVDEAPKKKSAEKGASLLSSVAAIARGIANETS